MSTRLEKYTTTQRIWSRRLPMYIEQCSKTTLCNVFQAPGIEIRALQAQCDSWIQHDDRPNHRGVLAYNGRITRRAFRELAV